MIVSLDRSVFRQAPRRFLVWAAFFVDLDRSAGERLAAAERVASNKGPRGRLGSVQFWSQDGPNPTSLDHFVGAGKQRRWDREAERLRGFALDYQLELQALSDREVNRLGALRIFLE
jgi:hypothetical protein